MTFNAKLIKTYGFNFGIMGGGVLGSVGLNIYLLDWIIHLCISKGICIAGTYKVQEGK